MGVAWCFGEVLVLLSMLHHRHCGVEPALSAHVYVTCWNVLGGILLRMHVVGRLLERSWSAGLLLLMALLFKWAVGGVVLWPEDFPGRGGVGGPTGDCRCGFQGGGCGGAVPADPPTLHLLHVYLFTVASTGGGRGGVASSPADAQGPGV